MARDGRHEKNRLPSRFSRNAPFTIRGSAAFFTAETIASDEVRA